MQQQILQAILIASIAGGILISLARFTELYNNPWQPALSNSELSLQSLQVDFSAYFEFTLLFLICLSVLILAFFLNKRLANRNAPTLRIGGYACAVLAFCCLVVSLYQNRHPKMYAHPEHAFGQAVSNLLIHLEGHKKQSKTLKKGVRAYDSAKSRTTIKIHGTNASFALRGLYQQYRTQFLFEQKSKLLPLHKRNAVLIFIAQDRGWFDLQKDTNPESIRKFILKQAGGFSFVVRNQNHWGYVRKTLQEHPDSIRVFALPDFEIFYTCQINEHHNTGDKYACQ